MFFFIVPNCQTQLFILLLVPVIFTEFRKIINIGQRSIYRYSHHCVLLWYLMSQWIFHSTSTQFCPLISIPEGPLPFPIVSWFQTVVDDRMNIPCRESVSVEIIWDKEKGKRRENWRDGLSGRERKESGGK